MIGNVVKLDLAELKKKISDSIADEVKEKIIDNIHPIGSIYLTMSSENPSKTFGGTWKLIAQGRTLVGIHPESEDDNLKSAGKEFGEAEHTLTNDEIPSHRHSIPIKFHAAGSISYQDGIPYQHGTTYYEGNKLTSYAGGGQAHNNYQPSFTCYIWQRIADPVVTTTVSEEG